MAKRVDVRFEGSETVTKAANKSRGAINNLNKKVKDSRKIWQNATFAVGAAIAAFYGITRAVSELVEAYREQEQAEAKLRSAILATGRSTEISTDSLIAYAGELQRITTFGDEATISAMAMLQSLADLNEQGIRQIIPALQDFAIGMGVDLETAASLVGKTLGSATNALSRYGIQIDMTGTKEEKLAELTAELNGKFGGMAETVADTATGAITQLGNAFGDLREKMGRNVAEAIEPMVRGFTDLIENINEHLDQAHALKQIWDDLQSGASLQSTKIEILEQALARLERQYEREVIGGMGYQLTLKDEIERLREQIQVLKRVQAEIEYSRTRQEEKNKTDEDAIDWTAKRIEIQTELEAKLRTINGMMELFGKTEEAAKQKSDAVKNAIKEMLDEGFTPAGRGIEIILELYGDLIQKSGELEETTRELIPVFDAFGRVIEMAQINLDNLAGMELRVMGMDRRLPAITEEEEAETEITAFAGTDIGRLAMAESPLMAVIDMVISAFMKIEGVAELLNMFMTALSATIKIIGPVLQPILEPLLEMLTEAGKIFGQMLVPVLRIFAPLLRTIVNIFDALSPILEFVAMLIDLLSRPLEVLFTVVDFLADKLIGLGKLIFYIITFQWGKIKHIDWGLSLEELGEKIEEIMERPFLYEPEPTPEEEIEKGIGSTTTIQRVPDIYIYQTFQGPIVGPGGMSEFGEFTAQALQDYAGIGGRIHIAEAVV